MTQKEQANELLDKYWLMDKITPMISKIQAKQCALLHIDLMIEKMNSYSDLESHLYQIGYGNTTIIAEIICLESIRKELELL